jgi:hypothetical protein
MSKPPSPAAQAVLAKAKLESEISCLMARFTKDSGLTICRVDIDEIAQFGSGERHYIIKVRAEL